MLDGQPLETASGVARSSGRLELEVALVTQETPQIRSLVLQDPAGCDLPPFEPGAHVDVFLPNGLVRQYSLVNHPGDRKHYLLGVLREKQSRGGSQWLHESLREGQSIEIGLPRNNFPLVPAQRSLLVGGGIGITPLLSMAAELKRCGADFQLFYCTRSREETAFLPLIDAAGLTGHVTLVHDGGDPRKGIDLRALLARPEAGLHVYCCGPAGLMNAVRESAAHWPTGRVHFEWFSADQLALGDHGAEANKPFTVVVASTGQALEIPADRSIAEVLEAAGVPVETLCREGVCGTCVTAVLDGEPDHRDSVLTEDERESEGLMTICCSRARSARLVLDL